MEEKITDSFGNICTILGGVLLGIAIVDQVSKTLTPEAQKLTSGEIIQDLKMLPDGEEKEPHKEKEKPSSEKRPAEQERTSEEKRESRPEHKENDEETKPSQPKKQEREDDIPASPSDC